MTWPGLKPVVYHTKQLTPILWYDLTRSQTRDLSHEAANTNSIVFDMTWPDLKPVIYHTKQQTRIHWYNLTRSQTRDLSHEAANTN